MKKITFVSVIILIICAIFAIQNFITLMAAYFAFIGTGYEVLPQKHQEVIRGFFTEPEDEEE